MWTSGEAEVIVRRKVNGGGSVGPIPTWWFAGAIVIIYCDPMAEGSQRTVVGAPIQLVPEPLLHACGNELVDRVRGWTGFFMT